MSNGTYFGCIISEGESVTILHDGQQKTVTKRQSHFAKVMEAVEAQDWDAVKDLISLSNSVLKYLREGEVEVKDGQLTYKGERVDNYMVEKILSFMGKKLPVENLLRCLNNLMENPSWHSVKQFYPFAEANKLPITERGTILGYKGVNGDYTSRHADKHGNHLDNNIGVTREMPRNEVEDNPEKACGPGLHVGSLSYAQGWAGHNGRVIIVEFNPRDVVSVPRSESAHKMRVCKYTVVDDYKGTLPDLAANSYKPYGEEEDTEG